MKKTPLILTLLSVLSLHTKAANQVSCIIDTDLMKISCETSHNGPDLIAYAEQEVSQFCQEAGTFKILGSVNARTTYYGRALSFGFKCKEAQPVRSCGPGIYCSPSGTAHMCENTCAPATCGRVFSFCRTSI